MHYFNKISTKSTVRVAYQSGADSEAYEAAIPNRLLEEPYDITALVYLTQYELAVVDSATKGTYYVRSGEAGTGYTYTKRKLPDDYVGGIDYYTQSGVTEKYILIPVIPRARPELALDREDPTDEELFTELIAYCTNLGNRVLLEAKAAAEEAGVKGAEEILKGGVVRTVTMEEYNALVAANKMEEGVIYAVDGDQDFLNEVVSAAMAEINDTVNEAVAERVSGNVVYAHYINLNITEEIGIEIGGSIISYVFASAQAGFILFSERKTAYTVSDLAYELSREDYAASDGNAVIPCSGFVFVDNELTPISTLTVTKNGVGNVTLTPYNPLALAGYKFHLSGATDGAVLNDTVKQISLTIKGD